MDNLEKIRQEIRKVLESQLKETDLVAKTKEDWEEQKEEIKKDLKDLLSNLEKDDYKEGLQKIDQVISGLQKWKKKINKNI